MTPRINDENRPLSDRDIYDFSGPLWERYHEEVRSKARFPRGYKEVNIFN